VEGEGGGVGGVQQEKIGALDEGRGR